MQCQGLSVGLSFELAILIVFALMTATRASAQQEKVLHSFNVSGQGGSYPNAGLISDAAGNLYGTTVYGGTGACGSAAPTGCGTVFELKRNSGGGWTEKVLHSFAGGSDGDLPQGGVIVDAAGNLYGTTAGVAGYCTHTPYTDCGTVFKLKPHTSGVWTETVLHNFTYNGTDGYAPYGTLARDAAGNLYGGTFWGGTYYDGTAFKLTPAQSGSWTESLYSFYWGKGVNGGGPGGLLLDAAGNLYGTASLGDNAYSGAVFELTPTVGNWTETTLYSFDIYSTGAAPNSSLIFDAAGNLYGTNVYGGSGATVCLTFGVGNYSASCGTVFKLTPEGGGAWTETTLHSFGNGTDGQIPHAGLIRDAAGNLHGTTYAGGTYGGGTVFTVKP